MVVDILAQPRNRGSEYVILINIIYVRTIFFIVLRYGGAHEYGPVCQTRFRLSFFFSPNATSPLRIANTERNALNRCKRKDFTCSLFSVLGSRRWWGVVHDASVLVMTAQDSGPRATRINFSGQLDSRSKCWETQKAALNWYCFEVHSTKACLPQAHAFRTRFEVVARNTNRNCWNETKRRHTTLYVITYWSLPQFAEGTLPSATHMGLVASLMWTSRSARRRVSSNHDF